MKNYSGITEQVKSALTNLKGAMFPEYFSLCGQEASLFRARRSLTMVLSFVLEHDEAEAECERFFTGLSGIKELIKTDVCAAYEGDPAATGEEEVILTYPGFTAISIYRIAHALYLDKVPMVPRMMTEYAHGKTGIDIHPGATIGPYFFIDHGTGVVIGETTTIGEHVKLYQHVTLGAKSFELGADGQPVKGIKRHPDIGNNVVIYAGATILGGNTRIGDNCVIGGNVWLTHSVEEGSTVIAQSTVLTKK